MPLKIRELRPSDIEEINKLSSIYFPENEVPNWMNDFTGAFVIQDETNEIVMAGGIEVVAEAILVTNKAKNRIKIGKALVEAQMFSLYLCKKAGIKELIAFTNDSEYAKHLVQHGFSFRDTALSMKVP